MSIEEGQPPLRASIQPSQKVSAITQLRELGRVPARQVALDGIEPPAHRIDATGLVRGGILEQVRDERVTRGQVREHARRTDSR